MDAGRYAYDKYAVGKARDPQSGREINDHELEYLCGNVRRAPAFRLSRLMLAAAKLYASASDAKRALEIVDDALKNRASPLRGLAVQGGAFEDRGYDQRPGRLLRCHGQALYNDARYSRGNPEKMMALQLQLGNTNEARKIQAALISRQSDERSDLSLDLVREDLWAKIQGATGPAPSRC